MAGKNTRDVTIYYKRLDGAWDGVTLENAVRQAMDVAADTGKIKDLWRHRQRLDPKDARLSYFINHHQDDSQLLFGDLVSFTAGRSQHLLANLGDVAEVDVETMSAPEKKEYLDSMMFWMLVGNNVLLIQSASLRADALEHYLNWLLKERTQAITNDNSVILVDQFALVSSKGKDLPDIREINIGGRVVAGDIQPRTSHEASPVVRDVGEIASSDDRNWIARVLGAVLGDDQKVNNTLKKVPDGTKLKVSVRLGYERTKLDADREALRDILVAVRNLPDSDLSAKTASGTITGDKIRLTYGAKIETVGDLLDQNATKAAMIEAYNHFLKSGQLPSN